MSDENYKLKYGIFTMKFTQLLVTSFRSSTSSSREIKQSPARLSVEEFSQGMMAMNIQEEQQKQSLGTRGTSKSQDPRITAQHCRDISIQALLLALTQQKNPKVASIISQTQSLLHLPIISSPYSRIFTQQRF